MKNFTKILFAALLLCFSSIYALAQQNDTLKIKRNADGEITFIRFKPDSSRSMQDAINFLKTLLRAGSNDEFRLIKKTADAQGFLHLKYQQYFKGIKVENGEYLIHGKNGMIESMNGHFYQVNIPSITPAVTVQQALDKALAYVNAKEYKWQDTAMQRFIKQRMDNPNATYYPKGELVITMGYLEGGNNLRLAWKFTISSLIPNNEQWIYVDAFTGEIIRETPLMLDANTPCTAQTMYSGTLGITGDSFEGGYRLRENRNGVSIETLNLHGTINYGNATDFTNTNTNWTTGSWANIGQDQQALDAHWGAEMVLDYWRIVQTRNSLDGNGLPIIGYVHYNVDWDNSKWDGTAHVMDYGDGDGTTFNPLTALDICAHEMGHGIDEFTANLTPGNHESGALNEGFSDIWAACVTHWAAPNKQTWLIGEDVLATTAFDCIRDLQNPKDSHAAEGPHPDTYHGQFWDPNGEPHTNSTVLSHWFYLLSQGGSGTNDLGNSYSVDGIGINEAQFIAFRGETMLTSGATYANARTMTIEAAGQLYGTNSCEVRSVTNAWYAVGVGDAAPAIYITGDNAFCTSTTYSLSETDGGTVTWSVSPSGIVSLTPSGNSVTATKISQGNATLTAILTVPCGNTTISKNISTRPVIDSFSVVDEGCYDGYESWKITAWPNMDNASNWDWQVFSNGNNYFSPQGFSMTTVHVQGVGGAAVEATYQDACGETSEENGVSLWSNCGADMVSGSSNITITPNPATNTIIITNKPQQNVESLKTLHPSNKASSTELTCIKEVKIYDVAGRLRKQQIFSGKSNWVQMDVSSLTPAIYLIQVSDGKNIAVQKLAIQ